LLIGSLEKEGSLGNQRGGVIGVGIEYRREKGRENRLLRRGEESSDERSGCCEERCDREG